MIAFYIIGFVLALTSLYFEFRRQLMMLQQNSYRNERYRRWLSESGDSTTVMRLVTATVAMATLSTFSVPLVSMGLIAAVSIVNIFNLAGRKYKKPLALTRRAWRITLTQWLLLVVVCFVVGLACHGRGYGYEKVSVAVLFVFCLSAQFTQLANWLLKPVEKHINGKFYNRAQETLRSMPGLKIVGITGSYGKTSTKHYLQRILSEQYSTLMTPGSYNTTLGVVRTVNELLKPYHEVFIVEMGAKQKGDIKEICDLVRPSAGIITAVGPQHLETFHTIEGVRDTKFELADALPADGLAVVNNDFEMIAGRKVDNVKCIRYGIENTEGCQYVARDIVYGENATVFTVEGGERMLTLTTQLLGECNISNLVAAIVVATELGVSDERIAYAVSRIEPVEHRLSRRRLPNGLTIIDDAFNSNPSGSKMALDVLSMMKHGHRFVITPGMIELGERQEELNHELGRHAAQCCDTAIVVNEYNRDAIVAGLKKGGMAEERILTMPDFNSAFAYVMQHSKNGDTVLIENDLPDTFK